LGLVAQRPGAPGQLDFLDYGCERAEAAGIEPERIVNTWPRDRLLAWAAKDR
jgi:putative hydrolase